MCKMKYDEQGMRVTPRREWGVKIDKIGSTSSCSLKFNTFYIDIGRNTRSVERYSCIIRFYRAIDLMRVVCFAHNRCIYLYSAPFALTLLNFSAQSWYPMAFTIDSNKNALPCSRACLQISLLLVCFFSSLQCMSHRFVVATHTASR